MNVPLIVAVCSLYSASCTSNPTLRLAALRMQYTRPGVPRKSALPPPGNVKCTSFSPIPEGGAVVGEAVGDAVGDVVGVAVVALVGGGEGEGGGGEGKGGGGEGEGIVHDREYPSWMFVESQYAELLPHQP